MSFEISLTIKNYHNRGGDLTLKLSSAQYSEQASNSGRVKLVVFRKPDQYSSRLGMFAFLRNTQNGYQGIGFTEATLTFRDLNDSGGVVSMAVNVFYDVGVDSVRPHGTNEEQIIFLAGRKTAELRIP